MKKKLLKYFFFFFLLSFLILNWGKVSFIFNKHVIWQFLSKPFEKKIEKEVPQLKLEEKKFEYTEKEDSIEIPKIGVLAPIIFVKSEEEIKKGLDKGVVFFPGSALPGEKGKTIIEGHSVPLSWPKINYNQVFSQLNELEEGDEIILNFNHQKFHYYVIKKIFVQKGEEIPEEDLTRSKNMLILISCWPLGRASHRILVVAEAAAH
ncbi:MAG: sortase [Patescibacteria group bacterium]|nr:sortase [Patescibacteria group bacterium]